MQIGVTYYQLNGDGGAVYVDNFSVRVDRSLPKIYAQHSDIIHGESGLVDIMLEGDFQPLTAIDLTFSGFHNILEFMEIVADETSLMGQLDWMIVENNTDNELITASIGTQSISQSGKLFSIRVNVDEALSSQFVPFDVIHFQGNENFNEFNTQSNSLNSKINEFITTPTISNLNNLRNQWKEALLCWQDVSFIEFGPAEYILLKNQVNIYPVDTTLIFSNITTGSYNLQSAQNYDSKGFQALDFLLHQPGLSDQDHVDYFENNINARTYLTDIGNDLSSNSQYVVDQWASYQTNFKNSVESNAQ